jgi:tyrosine-protein phosphatase YwqE
VGTSGKPRRVIRNYDWEEVQSRAFEFMEAYDYKKQISPSRARVNFTGNENIALFTSAIEEKCTIQTKRKANN